LPYIDTQRLSLVWLGFCDPKQINKLESTLIGSRDLLGSEKQKWSDAIRDNKNQLPSAVTNLILDMLNSLSEQDGFRKQAMPKLLYRYFSDMKNMFNNTKNAIKLNGNYALIVGHNKTTLGGKTFLINTPYLLGIIAEQCGWNVTEEASLQTYKRYGLNSKNSINCETLLILQNERR
jgi:site-specific DNA-methyltransferase (cytosine-N4-specific)